MLLEEAVVRPSPFLLIGSLPVTLAGEDFGYQSGKQVCFGQKEKILLC